MCATIVFKSCLVLKVPICTEEEWKLKQNYDKFGFFFEVRKNKTIRYIYELINDNVKKYRVAASGFIG